MWRLEYYCNLILIFLNYLFIGIIKLLFSGSLQLEFTMSTMIRPEAIPRLGFGNILLGAEITFRTGRFRLSKL